MKKFFKILFFIALIAAVVWTFVYLFKKSQPQEKVYETVEATIGTIQKKTVITGQINPRDEVAIKPQVSGIISKIFKEAGQMVKKDEVIAMVKIIPDVASLASPATGRTTVPTRTSSTGCAPCSRPATGSYPTSTPTSGRKRTSATRTTAGPRWASPPASSAPTVRRSRRGSGGSST